MAAIIEAREPRQPFMLILVENITIMPEAWEGTRSTDEISVTKKGPNLLVERVRIRKKV